MIIVYLIWGHRTIITKHQILKHHILELPKGSGASGRRLRPVVRSPQVAANDVDSPSVKHMKYAVTR